MLEQYVDGLLGPIYVRALPGTPEALAMPAYNDEVMLVLSDFYNNAAHDLLTLYYLTPRSGGNEPVPDAITVNGRFSANLPGSIKAAASAPGFGLSTNALYVDIEAGLTSTTLFHVVAANAFSMFTVSIDGVNLRIVEVDATAVVPFEVPSFILNVAQRVSFTVDWTSMNPHLARELSKGTKALFLRVQAMVDMYLVDTADDVANIPYYDAPGLVTASRRCSRSFLAPSSSLRRSRRRRGATAWTTTATTECLRRAASTRRTTPPT